MYSLHYFPNDSNPCKWYIKDEYGGLDYGRYENRYKASRVYMELVNRESKLKKEEIPMLTISGNEVKFTSDTSYSLAAINPRAIGCAPSTPPKCVQKEESAMTEYNMEVDQRNHLKRRLDEAKRTHQEALPITYHMNPLEFETKTEVEAALKNGQLMVDPEFFDANGNSRWGRYGAQVLMFVDLARDEKGYNAAKKLLDKAFVDAKDVIIVKPLADGLDALKAFEAATF